MGPSSYVVAAGAVNRWVVGKGRMDWLDIEPPMPSELTEEQLYCLKMQMDLVLRMGWGLVLHILAAGKLYMLLRHTSYSE